MTNICKLIFRGCGGYFGGARQTCGKARAAEMVTFVGNAKKAVAAYVLQNGLTTDVAEGEMLASGILDIDISKGMNCTALVPPDKFCFNDHYFYGIRQYEAIVPSHKPGIMIYVVRKKRASDTQVDPQQIYMSGQIYTTDGKTWVDSSIRAYDKIGQITCRALTEQGDNSSSCAIP